MRHTKIAIMMILIAILALGLGAWACAETTGEGTQDAPWEVDTWSALKEKAEAGGWVRLAKDVTRDAAETITIKNTAVTLDLNGRALDGGGSAYRMTYIFYVGDGGSLTIADGSDSRDGVVCNAWQSDALVIRGTGRAALEAGTLGGPKGGGSVYINGGSFTMSGGAVTGNGGNGVEINYGGSFTMSGGAVAGNSHEGVNIDFGGSFTMSGGAVTGNGGNGVDISNGSFTMSGGAVTGNGGNGVDIINGSFTVSGDVNITGNAGGDVQLCERGGAFVPIHIGGALADTARIGVSTDREFEDGEAWKFTDGLVTRGEIYNFRVTGRTDLTLIWDGNELAICKGYRVAFDAGEGTGSMDAVTVAAIDPGYTLPKSEFDPPDGCDFMAWSVAMGTDDPVTMMPGEKLTVTADTVVTAMYGPSAPMTEPEYCFHMSKDATKKVNVKDVFRIVVDGYDVTGYKSDNKKVATVTKQGRVKAVGAGTAKITVTTAKKVRKGYKTLTLTVKVTDPKAPKRVKIEVKEGKKTVKAGGKLHLMAVVKPDTARTALTWTTSDRKIATVSKKGVVKAKKPGKVNITVTTENGKRATITIRVKDKK